MSKPDTKEREQTVPSDPEAVVEKVRDRYGRIAEGLASGCGARTASPCCGSVESEVSTRIGYDEEQLGNVPEEANLGLGCGAPIPLLDLQPGETVLDLGSGGGLDAFLSAARVGTAGKVIGVDMTEEMIARATAGAKKAGLEQVEFRHGRLEDLPVEDGSVDAVTSNCVINLVPDKAQVFREVARVLKPGGRLVISDIILDGPLPEPLEKDLMAYVGCVAGALQRETYFGKVSAAGLTGIRVFKDVDYLDVVEGLLPDEVVELLQRTGLKVEDVRGVVRSVTFGAVKR